MFDDLPVLRIAVVGLALLGVLATLLAYLLPGVRVLRSIAGILCIIGAGVIIFFVFDSSEDDARGYLAMVVLLSALIIAVRPESKPKPPAPAPAAPAAAPAPARPASNPYPQQDYGQQAYAQQDYGQQPAPSPQSAPPQQPRRAEPADAQPPQQGQPQPPQTPPSQGYPPSGG